MTKAQVLRVMRTNDDAVIYVWHGEVYLDDGDGARMISPAVFCALYRDGAGEIAPSDASRSIWRLA